MIQMLPVFRGLTNENPYQHVRKFKDICETMKYNQITKESLKQAIRVLPERKSQGLKEKAKAWLLSLQLGTITTWVEVAEAFYRKFYSK